MACQCAANLSLSAPGFTLNFAAILTHLEKLIRRNKTCADFAEKFEDLIENDNIGSRNMEDFLEELVKLSHNLSGERQRHVRENMIEEEGN